MKQLFHDVAGEIFNGGGLDCSDQKGPGRRSNNRHQHQQGAMTVNRADGAVEKAALFAEAALAERAVDHFTAPAEEAVEHQQQKKEGILVGQPVGTGRQKGYHGYTSYTGYSMLGTELITIYTIT